MSEEEKLILDDMAKNVAGWMRSQLKEGKTPKTTNAGNYELWEVLEGKWTDPDKVKIGVKKAHCGYIDEIVPLSDMYNSVDVIRKSWRPLKHWRPETMGEEDMPRVFVRGIELKPVYLGEDPVVVTPSEEEEGEAGPKAEDAEDPQ